MLSAKQMKAVELFVSLDLTKTEVAKQLNVSCQTVTNWWHNEEFTEAIHKANIKRFERVANKAAKKMEDLIDSKNEGIAFAAAREVLNKAGYKEVEKVENTNKEIIVSINEDSE